MYVEITKESEDRLIVDKWRFWVRDDNSKISFCLDGYVHCNRKTTRHKLTILKKWSRLMGRNNTIERKDVVLPADIVQEAKELISSSIEFIDNH